MGTPTKAPPVDIMFDDGTTIHVVPRSRDALKAEADGLNIQTAGKFEGMYAIVFAALQRMVRLGEVDADKIPGTLAEFMDMADIEPTDVPDAEGNG